MAIICRSYNLLFVMAPRTACTALGRLLQKELGGKYLPREDIVDAQGFIRVQKKHCTLQDLLDNHLLTPEEASSLIKFTCVRNPFDSLVSLYIKKRSKYQPLLADPNSWVYRLPHYAEDMKFCRTHSFNEWILKNYTRALIKRIIGFKPSIYNPFTKGVDVIMRFENIQQDFQQVLKMAGISHKLSIPVVNRTSERSTNYHQYYTSISQKIVGFAFQNDLEQYGYTFN